MTSKPPRWTYRLACTAAWLALSSAGPSAARAADPTAELPAGGLAFAGAPSLVTEREDVVIAQGSVRVTYIVRNASDTARTILLAFGLPEIDMLALDNAAVDNPAFDAQNTGNYVGFAATVDGQPAEMFLQSNALALGLIDVTSALKSYGLPLYPLHTSIGEQLGSLADTAKADLLNRSIVRSADGQLEPAWTLRSALFWQQPFAAGQVRTLSINYQPIAGSGAWTADTASALQQRFCIPDAAATALTSRAARGNIVGLKWVTYLASAAAVSRGTVGQYRVTLDAQGKGTAYACGDSSTQRARESTLADHIAEGEIQVLFVE